MKRVLPFAFRERILLETPESKLLNNPNMASTAGDEKISISNAVVNDENIEKPTTTVVTDEEEEVILRKIDLQ